jgi:hypothetical protein
MNEQLSEILKKKISTKTIIISTNLTVDIEYLFNNLPVVDTQMPFFKKKEQIMNYIHSCKLQDGDIIYMKYKNKTKGKYITNKTKKKYMKNSLTIVMYIDNKCINFKLPTQGKIQMTGCKEEEQAFKCIKKLWEYIEKYNENIYSLYLSEQDKLQHKTFQCIFRTVMTNVNFNLGFGINRQLLNLYINKYTKFNSLLETSFGYTGVNIKIPYTLEFSEHIPTLSLIDNKWVYGFITQSDYIQNLSEKEQKKEISKKRNNTFLIFYSGVAIMSGMSLHYMQNIWYDFTKTITDAKKFIEE